MRVINSFRISNPLKLMGNKKYCEVINVDKSKFKSLNPKKESIFLIRKYNYSYPYWNKNQFKNIIL